MEPDLRISTWREAARLFARAKDTANAVAAWRELESAYRALASRSRVPLLPDATAAAAEAHLALGAQTFEEFKRQQIQPPLAKTLNRKVSLLQQVKKRAEETVAMRQAEPAVCALAQLGEAQMLLAQAIATSPAPGRLTPEERKLYRDALAEKAKPLFEEARSTLASADAKALELGVGGACASSAAALLERLGATPLARPQLAIARLPVAIVPGFVDADGKPTSHSSSELAPVSKQHGTPLPATPAQLGSGTGRGQ
jgi:hypothetical protein